MADAIELKKTLVQKDYWLTKGKFNYSESSFLFYIAKVDYEFDPDSLWLGLVFGDFGELSSEPCNICMCITSTSIGRKMCISSSKKSIFTDQELGQTINICRSELKRHPKLFEWIVDLYEKLLAAESDIRQIVGEKGVLDFR